VPWWWRPPGHGGSNLAIAGIVALAALQSVPFLWRRQQPAIVLSLTAAALAVKFTAHLNLWSASAAVLVAGYGLGAYGSRSIRLASRFLVAAAVVAAIVTLQATNGDHAAAIACALLATALAAGEVTAAHRDLVTGQAKQAFDEELASLTREVHDILAHQLSAIAVPGTKVIVRLRYTGSGIHVEVADDGPAGDGPGNTSLGGGAGLAGLRDRVTLLSGQFEAGQPGAGQFEAGQFEACARQQGFVVRAFLPSRHDHQNPHRRRSTPGTGGRGSARRNPARP
jgi:signal transduction histidine kinase